MAQVNWNQIKKDAGDMQPVPVGKYDAFIESAELKVAGSGNEYWKCKFKVQSGPHAGRVLYNNIVLSTGTPGALRAFFINMAALGLSQEQIAATGSDTNALTPLLAGRQALLTVGHQMYQEQLRENVERMEKHPSGPFARGAGAVQTQTTGVGTPAASAAPVPSQQPSVAPQPQPAAAAPVPAPAPAPTPAPAPSVSPPSEIGQAPTPAPAPEPQPESQPAGVAAPAVPW